jgi:hypothetical protein
MRPMYRLALPAAMALGLTGTLRVVESKQESIRVASMNSVARIPTLDEMRRARFDGLMILLLGSMVFILLSTAMEILFPGSMLDFKAVYYPAQSLIQHHDPYTSGCINLPTTLFILFPFAVLGYGPAHFLWIALAAGSLILASLLIWDLAPNGASVLSGALVAFLLVNSAVLVWLGNTAAVVCGLCVFAVWCFLEARFVPAGILCLAVSLAIKPHDAGLVWLYFLLAGKVYRKRALQTLLVTVALSLPAVLLVSQVAPGWPQEWHSNILRNSTGGAINDPAFASMGKVSPSMQIDLRSAISAFRNDPRIYNPITYSLCTPLLLVWAFVTLRSRPSLTRAWLALAAIAALSMLPTYHRAYDAKLLLLTVPAFAMLWAEGGLIARLALLVNAVGILLTSEFPWIILFALINNLHLSTTGTASRLLVAMLTFLTPLVLLVMSIFYLVVYARRAPGWAVATKSVV